MFFDIVRHISTLWCAMILTRKEGMWLNYEVNKNTLALIPVTEGNKCKVIEERRQYNLNTPSFKVIEHSCDYFGVSYKSRVGGSKKITKAVYKSPVLIEETSKLVFFPVTSPSRGDAMWISYNNILDYYKSSDNTSTIIRFKNGYKLEIPVSYYSFNNQYMKACRLCASLNNRISL